ncbi:Interleukin-17 receptor B [Camelus dromedarius]|uniref:Interleukin-17 receptor B n=1 Tax=Camelus dromedarius TaxID=9838 RepID=A0A5N4CYM9_CAMDR|nr:Interleukin-17 receptor B [Camelus dromedarius]
MGPSPEWMVRHTLTPGDLRGLRVEPVKSSDVMEDYSIFMNISWILRADGFPVELNTLYFIGAHNIPNANMNEDGPSMAVNFTSPERIKKTSSPTSTLLPPTKVLVVYPSEICFHHTVCYFTEFLQNHCRSEVILEKWQKKKIAEMGPVQWLTTQKKAADRVIFLLSNDVNTMCDGTCGKSEGSARENSQDLFPLAFTLFCSDLRSQTHLHKYVVVYFSEADTRDDYSALGICPTYHLMKDVTAFRKELFHIKQHVPVGRRLQACHNSCSSL